MPRIGGLVYEPVGLGSYTVAYDLYMLEVLRASGALTPEPDPRRQAEHTLSVVIHPPVLGQLTAGLLVEVGDPWTAAGAARLARRFNRHSRRADKVALYQAIADHLPAFFNTRQAIINDFPLIFRPPSRTGKGGVPELRGTRQFGPWDSLIRVLAGYNPGLFDEVLTWPLRDALLALEHHQREIVREDYRVAQLIHAIKAPWVKKGQTLKPPRVPAILQTE